MHEAWCCQEMESCREALKDSLVLEDVTQPPCCITLHPGFRPVCLEKWAIRNVARKYKTHNQRRYKQSGLNLKSGLLDANTFSFILIS